MRTIKKYFVIFAIAIAVIPCYAQTVNKQEAMQTALQYYNKHIRGGSQLRSTVQNKVTNVTPWTAGDTICMYAIDLSEGGWVLVSADGRTESVLAYSTKGSFDTNNMPDAMRSLFNLYCKDIRYAMDSLEIPRESPQLRVAVNNGLYTGSSDYYDPGNILLKLPEGEIEWRQSGPSFPYCEKAYNSLCPEADDGTCGHSPAGCGPVALGQLMRYWQWPPSANVATKEISPGIYGNYKVHHYDWNLMPVKITYNTPTEAARSVASLLKDIGFTSKTDYESDYACTLSDGVRNALGAFSYHYKISSLAVGDWREVIRKEISLGRPVIFEALSQSLSSGHWFIIDGFGGADGNNSNIFHINWGWGDQSGNSYIVSRPLNNLDPYKEESSSAGKPYVFFHNIFTEIYPICKYPQTLSVTSESIPKTESNCVSMYANDMSLSCKLETGKYIFMADEITLLPGFEAKEGVEVQLLTPAYQYCNSYGPGKKD